MVEVRAHSRACGRLKAGGLTAGVRAGDEGGVRTLCKDTAGRAWREIRGGSC